MDEKTGSLVIEFADDRKTGKVVNSEDDRGP